MTFSVVSCSNDDEEGIGSEANLIGTWERVSQIHQYKENGKVVHEDTEYNDGFAIRFNKDGTYQECNNIHDGTDYWDNGSTTWNYKNGIITFNLGYDKESCTVKELTNSKLVYETIDKDTEEGIDYESYYRDEYRKISE